MNEVDDDEAGADVYAKAELDLEGEPKVEEEAFKDDFPENLYVLDDDGVVGVDNPSPLPRLLLPPAPVLAEVEADSDEDDGEGEAVAAPADTVVILNPKKPLKEELY